MNNPSNIFHERVLTCLGTLRKWASKKSRLLSLGLEFGAYLELISRVYVVITVVQWYHQVCDDGRFHLLVINLECSGEPTTY